MKRVVITGTGIVSCIGIGNQAVAESLYHGRSGIGIDPEREEMGFYSPLTGLIPDFDPPPIPGPETEKNPARVRGAGLCGSFRGPAGIRP